MSDPRTILERAARRIDPRSDAFERLDRRRERKARNRRLTAGVVALLVAIGGSYAAFSVFRDSEGTIGGQGSGGFHALWPELTLLDAQRVQERADNGDPDVAWRLDPASVAGEFVNQAFGWDGYSVQAVGGVDPTTVSGPVEILVESPTSSCPLQISCLAPKDKPRSEIVVLDRLVNPDGIWSVVEVYNPSLSLRLPISPGATVVSGQEFLIPFQVPDGFKAEVGYTYIGTDCGGGVFTNYSGPNGAAHVFDVGPDGIRFTVADMSFEQRCEPGQSGSVGGGVELPNGASLNVALDGYVFIALQPTGAEPDDPFDASLRSAIANAPVAVAGVPVHFVPTSEAPSPGVAQPLPSVAKVSCTDAGTQISTPVVQPQPDGVHIAVDNSTGKELGLQIEGFGGENAPVGTTEIVRPIPPGVYGLNCTTDPQAAEPTTYESFEVQDPAGIWVSTDLTGCTAASGISGSFAGPAGSSSDIVGVQGTPVEVVTSTISGLQPTDVIGPAGYPSTADEANVRVVRDGNVVATYHLFPDSQGGWYIDSASACDGTDLASLGSGGGVSGSPGGELPTCEPNTGANGGPDGTQLHLVSQNVTFDANCLNAPAGSPFTILFDNLDPGVPKNVAIYPMSGCFADAVTAPETAVACPHMGPEPVFTGDIIDGTGNGIEIVYQVGALDAGTYYFQDDIHPSANGILIVA